LALKEGFDEIKNVHFDISATENEKHENDFLHFLGGIVEIGRW
jgi:hypothetical protein